VNGADNVESSSDSSSSNDSRCSNSIETLETWIRLEDGSESGRVVLNATYGGPRGDAYPIVEDRESGII